MSEFLPIGFTEKPHGIDGEIKLRISESYLAHLADIEVVYITIKNKPTPYFIEELRGGTKLIAKLEDVNTREEALVISSQELSVRATDLKLKDNEIPSSLHFAQCVGYTVIDATDGIIGVIDEIMVLPQQEMAVVQYHNKEVLIPLAAQYITKTDKAAKTLHVNLPEGLLDL